MQGCFSVLRSTPYTANQEFFLYFLCFFSYEQFFMCYRDTKHVGFMNTHNGSYSNRVLSCFTEPFQMDSAFHRN